MPPPPEWILNLPLIGAKIAALWANLLDRRRAEITAKAAPYIGAVVIWSRRSAGQHRRVAGAILVDIILAAAMYANGERTTERLVRFGQRLADRVVKPRSISAGQTIRGVALGVVVTAFAQTVVSGLGLSIAEFPSQVFSR